MGAGSPLADEVGLYITLSLARSFPEMRLTPLISKDQDGGRDEVAYEAYKMCLNVTKYCANP